jgi:hypothetical protein
MIFGTDTAALGGHRMPARGATCDIRFRRIVAKVWNGHAGSHRRCRPGRPDPGMNLAKILVDLDNDLAVVAMTNFPEQKAEAVAAVVVEQLYKQYVAR